MDRTGQSVPRVQQAKTELMVKMEQSAKGGPAGQDGIDGQDGAIGPTGPAGQDGIDGQDGAIGPTGPAGQDGIDGQDGAIGPTGPQVKTVQMVLMDRTGQYTVYCNGPAGQDGDRLD